LQSNSSCSEHGDGRKTPQEVVVKSTLMQFQDLFFSGIGFGYAAVGEVDQIKIEDQDEVSRRF
jgi:hypothetical protein